MGTGSNGPVGTENKSLKGEVEMRVARKSRVSAERYRANPTDGPNGDPVESGFKPGAPIAAALELLDVELRSFDTMLDTLIDRLRPVLSTDREKGEGEVTSKSDVTEIRTASEVGKSIERRRDHVLELKKRLRNINECLEI